MSTPSIVDAPLSPHWAFVVQLREGTGLTSEAMYGRVEHIATGQATLFTSLEEVRAFMAQVLIETTRGRLQVPSPHRREGQGEENEKKSI